MKHVTALVHFVMTTGTEGLGGIKQYHDRSVHLSHTLTAKMVHYSYHRTLIGSPMVEVKLTSQHGPIATGSGQNGIDIEKFTSSLSQKCRQIEPRLLLNMNWKS